METERRGVLIRRGVLPGLEQARLVKLYRLADDAQERARVVSLLGREPSPREDVEVLKKRKPAKGDETRANSFLFVEEFDTTGMSQKKVIEMREKLARQKNKLRELAPYFNDERLRRLYMPFSTDKELSCRDMDWLVTNYSIAHNVHYKWRLEPGWPIETIVVNDKYKQWLNQYGRDLFDIFRRGPRIYFQLDEEEHVTTVAQMHFLHFAERYGVLQWLHDNITPVSRSQCDKHAERRREDKERQRAGITGKRKRQQITTTPLPTCQLELEPVEFRWI